MLQTSPQKVANVKVDESDVLMRFDDENENDTNAVVA